MLKSWWQILAVVLPSPTYPSTRTCLELVSDLLLIYEFLIGDEVTAARSSVPRRLLGPVIAHAKTAHLPKVGLNLSFLAFSFLLF
jgi:hypothetical protein